MINWDSRAGGFALGVSAHFIWGFFPLYFVHLAPALALEVIAHRAFWGFVFCLLALLVTRKLAQLRAITKDRAAMVRLGAGGFLVVINWSMYVWAVLNGHTVDAALGYFINPLVTVMLALVVLRERISRLQGVSLVLGGVAVAVMVVGMGKLPWISLVLAFSFGFYSLVKKSLAAKVAPLVGMAIETGALAPFLAGYFIYLLARGESSFQTIAAARPGVFLPVGAHLALLVGAGVLTVIPLVLFASAARRLPLGVLGMIQYIGPIMQLLIGIFVFHEAMAPVRWVGVGIVWVGLGVLSFDVWAAGRRGRKLARLAAAQSLPSPPCPEPG